MNNIIKSILVILGLIAVYCIYKAYTTDSTIVIDPKETLQKIDSLQNTINILQKRKDSIQVKVDTIKTEIKENEKKYVQISNTIVRNTPTEDYKFFSEYIEQNKSRLDSIYNF